MRDGRRRHGRILRGGALGLVLLYCAAAGLAPGDKAARPGAGEAEGVNAGLTAHRDPSTGRFVVPSAGVAPQPVPEVAERALSREFHGLVEEAGTTPAGGVRLSLEGRFRSRMVARRGADGSLVIRCEPEAVGRTEPPPAADDLAEAAPVPASEIAGEG